MQLLSKNEKGTTAFEERKRPSQLSEGLVCLLSCESGFLAKAAKALRLSCESDLRLLNLLAYLSRYQLSIKSC